MDPNTDVKKKRNKIADESRTNPESAHKMTTAPTNSLADNKTAAAEGAKFDEPQNQQSEKFKLSFRPKYFTDWNGPDNIVDDNRDDSQNSEINSVYEKLGGLKLIEVAGSNPNPQHVTGDRVAKGLIRHLLQSQIYYSNEKCQRVGYALGSKLIDEEQFFSMLFSGIMAETIVRVPHYVYTINFCDKLMKSMSKEGTGLRTDPDFTIAVFSLMEAVKNIHEETLRQYDGSGASAAAYGWLNVWLLGVQKILICKVSSDMHLRMFRNAVAHHQFFLINNYVQIFNKTDNGSINWMVRITLGDMFTLNQVLKMLHNSGYILNSSQDDQNMERRKRGGDDAVLTETLEGLLISVGIDPKSCPYKDVLAQCNNNVEAAFENLKAMYSLN